MLGLDYGGSFADLPKKNLYQKISLYKQNKFQKAFSFTKSDMIKIMKKAEKCLKKIDMIIMRSDIEMERYENTTVPAFLWQEDYIANFYFFIVMIGYIDMCINEEKRNISYNSHFLWVNDSEEHQKKIEKSKERINTILLDRDEIVNEFLNNINSKDSFYEMIERILKSNPSYLSFIDLYKDSEENNYQLSLQQHLINAYNIGYISGNNNYSEKMKKYRELLADLNKHKKRNKDNLETIKVKNKTKNK